jgi:Fic family protein
MPTPAWKTKDEMRLLHEAFTAASASGKHHPLVLTAAYILDFLLIHPFRDGNGRMSRLLTLLLLYRSNYDVGRFISVEKIIAESKETYYESLAAASTTNWETGKNDPIPWIRYFLGILIRAYTEFEARTGALGPKGAKSEAIRAFVRSSISTEFTIKDIRKACPGVSDDLIRKVLGDLRSEGVIGSVSKGPSARYRRLRTDF